MKRPRLHILQPGSFDVSHETFWGATPLCVLLNFEALLQLSASGVNIVTTGVTNRGLDATGLKTTLKILNSYAQLEEQGVEGENISAAKVRIEGMMDKVVDGFEKQLDLLFQGDAMDITADVEVLERMLAKDGLSGQEGMTLGL